MAKNEQRRKLLCDKAIAVLAADGVHGLTHRVVDQAADVPLGTTKNYYPTRDALLRAAAERAYQRYQDDLAQLEAAGVVPTDRTTLAAMLAELLRRARDADRVRLLATLEVHAEATRNPALRTILGNLMRHEYALYERMQVAAGLPVNQARNRVVSRCIHAALLSLITQPQDVLVEIGLGDLDAFVAEVLDTVYPRRQSTSLPS
ncbi:MAG: TetR/AcrR family transcriptional regulator [Sciscionella sp.]|nr:TetR/AcrR family transcriptional regulator [Sciscionella sp.]